MSCILTVCTLKFNSCTCVAVTIIYIHCVHQSSTCMFHVFYIVDPLHPNIYSHDSVVDKTFYIKVYIKLPCCVHTSIYKGWNSLFVCLTGRPCGTRLGPGGPDSSKSSSQAKKPIISMLAIMTYKNRLKKRTSWLWIYSCVFWYCMTSATLKCGWRRALLTGLMHEEAEFIMD